MGSTNEYLIIIRRNGIIIGLIISRAGLGFGKSAILVLVDALDDPQLISKMGEIISQFSEIQSIENIRIRQSGPFYFADLEVQMVEKETLKSLSIVIHAIEDRLKEFNPRFDTIIISVEPHKKMKIKVAVPTDSTSVSLEKLPVTHFGLAPAFMIIDLDLQSQDVLSYYIIKNHHFNEDKKRGILAAELLVNENIDILLVKDPEAFGKGPKEILHENRIDVFQYEKQPISKNLQRLLLKSKKESK